MESILGMKPDARRFLFGEAWGLPPCSLGGLQDSTSDLHPATLDSTLPLHAGSIAMVMSLISFSVLASDVEKVDGKVM